MAVNLMIPQVFLLICVGWTLAADPNAILYPPTLLDCVKGVERRFKNETDRISVKVKDCIGANPDVHSLSFKACLLLERHWISTNDYPPMEDHRTGYEFYCESFHVIGGAFHMLGIDSSTMIPEAKNVEKRLETCEELNFVVPNAATRDFKQLSPKDQKKFGILVTCIEDAWKC